MLLDCGGDDLCCDPRPDVMGLGPGMVLAPVYLMVDVSA